jgi:hypothetical protein
LVTRSGNEQLKLLSERGLRIAGVLSLSFAHHVNHLNAIQDHSSGRRRLESKHRSDTPLDGPMILFNAVIEVGTLPNPNRLEAAS